MYIEIKSNNNNEKKAVSIYDVKLMNRLYIKI